jgi:hypothetical protein
MLFNCDFFSFYQYFTYYFVTMVWFMVLNATFNNISVISWRSVLLVEETGKNHRPVATDKLKISLSVQQWKTRSFFTTSYYYKHKCRISVINRISTLVFWISKRNHSLCLNFFHLLSRKPNLEKCSIYSNKFFHNFHLSESSFTCPGFGQVG